MRGGEAGGDPAAEADAGERRGPAIEPALEQLGERRDGVRHCQGGPRAPAAAELAELGQPELGAVAQVPFEREEGRRGGAQPVQQHPGLATGASEAVQPEPPAADLDGLGARPQGTLGGGGGGRGETGEHRRQDSIAPRRRRSTARTSPARARRALTSPRPEW